MKNTAYHQPRTGMCSRCKRKGQWNMVGRWCRPCYLHIIGDNPRWRPPPDTERAARIERYRARAAQGLPLFS